MNERNEGCTSTLDKLFFQHIPKTAGTSFVNVLVQTFGAELSANYIEGMRKEERGRLGGKRFISGHLFYDEIFNLPYISSFKTVVLFRDPYARLASHLRYMDRYNMPQYAEPFAALGTDLQVTTRQLRDVDFASSTEISRFLENVNDWGRAAFNNCQTRFLACSFEDDKRSPYAALQKDSLSLALDRLRNFDFIGVSEHIRDVLTRIVGPLSCDIPRSNTMSSNRKLDHTDAAIRDAMRPSIEADIVLYDEAAGLSSAQRVSPMPCVTKRD